MDKQITKETYRTHGVAVTKYTPKERQHKTPVIMVHGGNHGAWCWEQWAELFCQAGYEVHALDWYSHGDSDHLPEADFLKRSIASVASEEITFVAEQTTRAPILVGHSMGGLASAVYAAKAPVERLILVAPVLPSAARAEPIPLPVDMTKPFQPFTYEQAKQFFFTTLDDAEAHKYHALLVPESPQAVHEATQWSVDVPVANIAGPVLVIGDELDHLIPAAPLETYAQMLDAEYFQVPAVGHCDLLLKEPVSQQTAQRALDWLAGNPVE